MMRTPENACYRLVTLCADLKSHESAVIISNDTTADIGDILSQEARKISQNVIHKIIPLADMHGKEPPAEIAGLMAQANVIFGLTKMSMAHTQARHNASLNGARYLSLPDYTLELLTRPALFVDFKELSGLSKAMADVFTEGKKVLITSKLGTHLTLDITGRTGNAAPGWCYAPGILASPPDAEANVPPLETETDGILVVDGSIPCQEIGLLQEPLVLHIKKGKVVNIEGKSAAVLNQLFDKFNTDATRVAAEFGIGLNPAAELIGSMLEDEGCMGTIHIGFGSNITIGGNNRVPFHLDTIVRDASVYVDGKLIMEEGSIEKFIDALSEPSI
jgi:leucyl aminopeptidase (aminopeptidase T)